MVKNPPANEGDARDGVSISGSGRTPRGRNGNPSSNLAWRIQWAEEPGGQSPWSPKKLDMTERLTLYETVCNYYYDFDYS